MQYLKKTIFKCTKVKIIACAQINCIGLKSVILKRNLLVQKET